MKTYCKHCGHKLEEVESGFYNEETGEKEVSKSCVNQKCDYSIKKCRNCSTLLKGSWLPSVCEQCFYKLK